MVNAVLTRKVLYTRASYIRDLSIHCSHEIKRHLLLGRKVMTNLDSILKSRDVTLPTKVHQVQSCGFSSGHMM